MTKDDIIHAAFLVWERDLYKSMSLSSVAEYLGVSKAALYRHFMNKEALVEAMYQSFFDDYFSFIEPRFKAAALAKNETEGLFIVIRAITEFYARNRSAFLFSLVQLSEYKNTPRSMGEQMIARGMDVTKLPFFRSNKKHITIVQFSSIVAIFITAMSYRKRMDSPGTALSPREVKELLDRVEYQISCGLGFAKEELDSIDYIQLEKIVTDKVRQDTGQDNLLKAVANAIAQAGLQNASMELVAKHAGLSKSGLYSHFKNKEDMLRSFFKTEFDKISNKILSIPKTDSPAGDIYLIVFSIIKYLESRQDIMIALDWLRIQRLDMSLSIPPIIVEACSNPRFIKKVPGTKGKQMSAEELPHLFIFCVMAFLKKCLSGGKDARLSKNNIRCFFRFLVSGIKGGIL